MHNNALLSTHSLFSIRILLGLLGAIITYGYGEVSHDYWLFMLPVFAVLELLPYYINTHSSSLQERREIILRWLGGLVCAFFVFSLHVDGRLFHEETALIILFILVLMLYLDCLKKPTLRSAFVVGFLFLLGLLITYTDVSIGVFVLLALASVLWSYINRSRYLSHTMNA